MSLKIQFFMIGTIVAIEGYRMQRGKYIEQCMLTNHKQKGG